MNINKINNTNFGRIKYEGTCNGKIFRNLEHRPQKYLTDEQNKLSKIIENSFAKKPNNYLEFNLGCHKKTDIHFTYSTESSMTVRLLKKGISKYNDIYYYTPYNKAETSEIKLNFDLSKKLDMAKVREKIDKFIHECREYLTDANNSTNHGIEKALYEKW